MKKPYVKPELRYENFALSESIAQACDASEGWIVRGNQDVTNCYAETGVGDYEGIKLFNNQTCNQTVESDCYTVFSNLDNLRMGSY